MSKTSIKNLVYFFFPKPLRTMLKFSLVSQLLLILHCVYTRLFVLYFSCFLLPPQSFEGQHSLFHIICPSLILHTLIPKL